MDEAEACARGPDTKGIDLNGRRVIPGLNDSHLHIIRAGTLVTPADLVALSDDYFHVAEEDIRRIESVLTVTGGKVVYGAEKFATLNSALPPIGQYGGYANEAPATHSHTPVFGADGRLWELGCGCAV